MRSGANLVDIVYYYCSYCRLRKKPRVVVVLFSGLKRTSRWYLPICS
jgi:hypothetical protein